MKLVNLGEQEDNVTVKYWVNRRNGWLSFPEILALWGLLNEENAPKTKQDFEENAPKTKQDFEESSKKTPILHPKLSRILHTDRKKLNRCMSELARDALYSIKCGFDSSICNIDLPKYNTELEKRNLTLNNLKETFFNLPKTPEYSRLPTISKLLLCQYKLNEKNPAKISTPFTFRLPVEMHGLKISPIANKIQKSLKAELSHSPDFWFTLEHSNDIKITDHVHGEILINQDELEGCRKAFRKLYAKLKNKTPKNKAIRFHLTERQKQTSLYGEFYSVCNWVSYATENDKQRIANDTHNKIFKKPVQEKAKFHYISQELNRSAANFYNSIKR